MRLRLLLSFAVLVLVSVIGVVVIARQGAVAEVRTFMFRGGMYGSQGLAGALQDYYAANGSWQGVETLLPGSGSQSRGKGQGGMGQGMGMMSQRLRVADAKGIIAADSSGQAVGGQLSQAEIANAIPLKVSGRTVGYLLPEGGMPYSQVEEQLLVNRLNRAALTAGLIGGGLALLLALLLAYYLLRPVRDLTRAAHQLGKGDLSARVPVRGDDELADLGRTFNQMATSLQASEQSRQAVTADIAHELRTPLAVQRAHLEALQDGIYPLSSENLQPILDQNLLLTRLVEDLRTLALAEAGQLKLERMPTDIAALVQRAAERFLPAADARQVTLQVVLPPARQDLPLLNLDPQRVDQILGNLLSNALRYTPDGGRILLSASRTTGGVCLCVQDSGPGIPPEALPHVFQRFYRADKSRSRAEGGSGLGLAIARQLAEAHGGCLEAANHPQGGAVFTLTLPG